jgi:hypothetical protein
MKARFRGSTFEVVFTEHAKQQMHLRGLEEAEVLKVIETGQVKAKNAPGKKYWVFKKVPGRKDNLISVSLSIEEPNLIVITTMVNWRPT